MDIYAIYIGGCAVDVIEAKSAKRALAEFFNKNKVKESHKSKYWAESIYA